MAKHQPHTSPPINLALWTMRFPITAVVSILHRISGLLLFIFLPLGGYGIHRCLVSPHIFNSVKQAMHTMLGQTIVLLIVIPSIYHTLAGSRHLMMDLGFGESWQAAKYSAYSVLVLTFLLSAIIMGLL